MLGSFYERDQSWTEVSELLSNLLRSTGDRLVVADSDGLVVGDTGNDWVGETATDVGLTGGTAIAASGDDVGDVYLFSTFTRGGPGYGHGAASQQSTVSNEQNFLDRVNMWLAIVAIIAAVVALALGGILMWQITRPVKSLVTGARQVAQRKPGISG